MKLKHGNPFLICEYIFKVSFSDLLFKKLEKKIHFESNRLSEMELRNLGDFHRKSDDDKMIA